MSDVVKGSPLIDDLSEIIHKMMAHRPKDRIAVEGVREQMDRLLFKHALELKKIPTYREPTYLKVAGMREHWERKVAFAQELHKNCIKTIFSTIFQSQEFPELSPNVQKIVFTCPGCNKKLHVYRHMDGKKGKCPGCSKAIIIKIEQKRNRAKEE